MSESGWLIVGLGNPGPTYAGHRHNVGFMVADELARRAGTRFKTASRLRSEAAEVRVGPLPGTRAVLSKPRTFMNDSGAAVAGLSRFYSVDVDHLVVVHDELDIPFDTMRVKRGGGDNGHNGLKSVRTSLGTGEFYRVRIGIGRPPGRQDAAAWVLSNFTKTERDVLPMVVDRAADAVETLLRDGLDATQQRYNS